MRKFLTLGFIPPGISFGLLILRVSFGVTQFLRHGVEKVIYFPQMAAHFPNPLHIGVYPSLGFAMLSDVICSLLVAVGLFTRWAALIIVINIFIAWSLVHHYEFFGHGAEHGELCVLYIAAYLALVFMGAGKYSLDQLIHPSKGRG